MLSHVFIGVRDFDRALAFYRVLMPVLGRLFSLNRRLRPATQLAPSQRERIEQPPD